ncbi:hypothetical protein A1O1_01163 [Capronia coronata CBS 617.96]|uniref:Zn(2)-C6 fungal-type domain-containing protein n=1 Tax=Capronia coronata CBS 617.96 TaxID=1182541 RepID=W9YT11_9EURO|nr:uncharacterized protein A1O1_01163 [Capronia coronata CBS 617.96]EXJ96037.1 hypothetical protein A1O1_01163 [Capronia coronata CBS 617.96]
MGPTAEVSADDGDTHRAVKKRASQACHNCRTRKVKCDLITFGSPCSNCVSDDVECLVVESRRSRKYRLQKRRLNGLVSLPPLSQAPPKFTTASSLASSTVSSDATITLDPIPQLSQDTPEGPSTTSTHLQSPPSVTTSAASFSVQSNGGLTGSASINPQLRPLPGIFPSYIRPPRPDIRPDDVEFLIRRGALLVPQPELRDQLLRCFVLFVYPYMPTIELADFLGAIDGHDGSSKISLVVFQAVMFAGTAYVDLDLLQQAGYSNRRAARSDFYQKVKLLYDFDWDVDRVALIQSLLLMNYWYVSENDQKDPWHWLGVCVSLATSIGMNSSDTSSRNSPQTRRLWRRIWWTCVMRDRIIAVSMRRPIRIADEDINLPPLTAEDFDLHPISTSLLSLRQCRLMADSTSQRMLAEMCVAKVQLLLSLGRILHNCYTLRSFGGSTSEVTMLYTPKRSGTINDNDFAMLQDELSQWSNNLPMSCWLDSAAEPSSNKGDGVTDGNDPTDKVLFLHRSVLKMLFLVATEALDRPQTLSASKSRSAASSAKAAQASTMQLASTSKVKEAADRMAEMIQSLHDRDLVRYLPPLSVTFMLLAIAAFMVEIKKQGLEQTDLQGTGKQCHVHRCLRALLGLRDIWPIADSACVLVGQMINRCQVEATLGISILGIKATRSISATALPTTRVQKDKQKRSAEPSAGRVREQVTVEVAQDIAEIQNYKPRTDATNKANPTPVVGNTIARPGPEFAVSSLSNGKELAIAGHDQPSSTPATTIPGSAARYNPAGAEAGIGPEETMLLDFNFDFDFNDFDQAGTTTQGGHHMQLGHGPGHISNGHALHMDIALAECYPLGHLGEFDNSVLDFDFDFASAGSGHGFEPAEHTSYASSQSTRSMDPWTTTTTTTTTTSAALPNLRGVH